MLSDTNANDITVNKISSQNWILGIHNSKELGTKLAISFIFQIGYLNLKS